MSKPLRLLIVDDEEEHALRVVEELTNGGFDVSFERVETLEQMVLALESRPFDVIVSDYVLQHAYYSAPLALELVKARKLERPFIIVSGTAGEDAAVEAIRAGAQDFMLKGKFARLVPAVERELKDVFFRAEQAALRDQLLVSDRMAAVGTLAAGVAHEINNPLTSLLANLAFAARDVALMQRDANGGAISEEMLTERVKEIGEQLTDAGECANRIKSIVRDLKTFCHSSDQRVGPVDVHRVLESSLRMASGEIRHRARLVKDFAPVAPILGNEARIGQVLLNLIVNAAQSIPEGMTARNEIRIATRQAGNDKVLIEVRDTGCGMEKSVLARIFDPFFTTKPIGEGTGLGLPICQRIVASLHGSITVESQVGVGSVFRVVLPVATGVPQQPVSPPALVAAGRRCHILVIDDEATLGRSIKRMLTPEHGVQVVTGGKEAIALINADKRFDVIICDLMMPEMTGMDLHRELARSYPGLADKMIFMTGGAFTTRAREFLERVRNPRIEKPFQSGVLKGMVSTIADRG